MSISERWLNAERAAPRLVCDEALKIARLGAEVAFCNLSDSRTRINLLAAGLTGDRLRSDLPLRQQALCLVEQKLRLHERLVADVLP